MNDTACTGPARQHTWRGCCYFFFFFFSRWDPLPWWGVSCKELSYTCSFIVFRSHLRGRKKQEESSFQHLNAQEYEVVQNLTFSDLLQQENSFQNKFVWDEQISNLNLTQTETNLDNTNTGIKIVPTKNTDIFLYWNIFKANWNFNTRSRSH